MPYEQRWTLTTGCAALCVGVIVSATFLMSGWGALTQTAVYALAALFLLASVSFCAFKRDALLKCAFVLLTCLMPAYVALVVVNNVFGLDACTTAAQKLERIAFLIRRAGKWKMAAFVAAQVLQILVLPVPSAMFYAAGAYVWGAPTAFGLAFVGVSLGSVLSFVAGRTAGRAAARWAAGECANMYVDAIGHKGTTPFMLMQLTPFFPDGILCAAAGLGSMRATFFICTALFIKPLSVALCCFFPTVMTTLCVWCAAPLFLLFAVLVVIYIVKQK